MKKFIFLSFWKLDFDAVFDNVFANLFTLTNINEVCNFNVKNPNKHIWIQKFTLLKMADSQLETFVLRRGAIKIGQTYVDSPSKRLIYISIIEIQVQIGLLKEIFEAITFCRS